MTCREEILAVVAHLIRERPNRTFHVDEVTKTMHANGSRYQKSTVRTHVGSKMRRGAPSHHVMTYPDFERVGRGLYRLL